MTSPWLAWGARRVDVDRLGRPGAFGAVGLLRPRAARSPAREARADRLRRGSGSLARGVTNVLLAGTLLVGCVAPAPLPAEEGACAPPPVTDGSARVRALVCGADRVAGGEGRNGDWILENAVARFVVRRPGAGALTTLQEDGGTLVDAVRLTVDAEGRVVQASEDLLVELRPDGDRSSAVPFVTDEGAGLRLPGFSWWLPGDGDALEVRAEAGEPVDGTLVFAAGDDLVRVDASARRGDSFLGVDALATGTGWRSLTGLTRAGLSEAGVWPAGAEVTVDDIDADAIEAVRDGRVLARWPRPSPSEDTAGEDALTVRVPDGATLRGARDGCAYEGLVTRDCAWLRVRVTDEEGDDLTAEVVDGDAHLALPPGGGVAPVGPSAAPRRVWIWAGPAYEAVSVEVPAGDAGLVTANVRLRRAFDPGRGVLARYDVVAAPDARGERSPAQARDALLGQGVGVAVLVADDEVVANPGRGPSEGHGVVHVAAGSRTAGWITSWPWAPSSRNAAHGAVPWQGLSPLDQLAWAEHGDGDARRTMVTANWVRAALAEASPAAWAPRPDAVWLAGLDDLDAYTALLDRAIAIAPAGPQTWLALQADPSAIAADQALLAGRSSGGTGPRATLVPYQGPAGVRLHAQVDAPAWARVNRVTLVADGLAPRALPFGRPVLDGTWTTDVAWPKDARWAYLVVEGARAWPWSPSDRSDPAFAVSAPAWFGRP